jgi:transposase
MPPKYGPPKTVWERHKKQWSEKDVWKRIMESLVSYSYQKRVINVNYLSVDSSTVSTKKGRGER